MLVINQVFIDALHLCLLALAVGYLIHEVGLLSLGHVAAVLVGAYGFAFAMGEPRGAMPSSVGFSILLMMVMVVTLALVAMRVRDDIFAVTTLALAEVTRLVAQGAYPWTGGSLGYGPVNRPSWLADDGPAALLAFGCVSLTAATYVFVQRSVVGLQMGAVRDQEMAAVSLGIPTQRRRFIAVCVAGLVGCLVGALQVGYLGVATPTLGRLDISLQALAVALIALPFWRHAQPERGVLAIVLGSFSLVGLPVLLRYVLPGDTDEALLRQALFGLLLFVLVHPSSPLFRAGKRYA